MGNALMDSSTLMLKYIPPFGVLFGTFCQSFESIWSELKKKYFLYSPFTCYWLTGVELDCDWLGVHLQYATHTYAAQVCVKLLIILH